MKNKKGITLLTLIITVIILLLLAFVVTNIFDKGNIISQTINVAEKAKIQQIKEKIEQEIVKMEINSIREISIEQIIEKIKNNGIIIEGVKETGQVKTEEGYIYQIQQDEKSGWKVEYVGKGELDSGIQISLVPNTTGITDKVTIKVIASSTENITSYIDASGNVKNYTETSQIEEIYEVSKNGTYTFKVIDEKGNTVSKTIEITNILTDEIIITANQPEGANYSNVTVVWPSGSEKGTKQISIDGGNTWKTYTGDSTTIKVTQDTTVKARVQNSTGEIKTATLTVILALGFLLTFMVQGNIYTTIDKVKTVSFPEEDPSLTGSTFTGWYYDEARTLKANVGDSIIKNTNLYAGWQSYITNKNNAEKRWWLLYWGCNVGSSEMYALMYIALSRIDSWRFIDGTIPTILDSERK